MITLTKLKLAGGDETPRFEATLCWHGEPVAAVSNSGTGGPCRVWWAKPAKALAEIRPTDRETVAAVMRFAAERAKAVEPDLFAKLDPEQPGPFIGLWTTALDFVVFGEIEATQERSRQKRRARRLTATKS